MTVVVMVVVVVVAAAVMAVVALMVIVVVVAGGLVKSEHMKTSLQRTLSELMKLAGSPEHQSRSVPPPYPKQKYAAIASYGSTYACVGAPCD